MSTPSNSPLPASRCSAPNCASSYGVSEVALGMCDCCDSVVCYDCGMIAMHPFHRNMRNTKIRDYTQQCCAVCFSTCVGRIYTRTDMSEPPPVQPENLSYDETEKVVLLFGVPYTENCPTTEVAGQEPDIRGVQRSRGAQESPPQRSIWSQEPGHGASEHAAWPAGKRTEEVKSV